MIIWGILCKHCVKLECESERLQVTVRLSTVRMWQWVRTSTCPSHDPCLQELQQPQFTDWFELQLVNFKSKLFIFKRLLLFTYSQFQKFIPLRKCRLGLLLQELGCAATVGPTVDNHFLIGWWCGRLNHHQHHHSASIQTVCRSGCRRTDEHLNHRAFWSRKFHS